MVIEPLLWGPSGGIVRPILFNDIHINGLADGEGA